MNKPQLYFKDRIPFSERESEAKRVRSKYPNRYPLIVEKAETSNIIENIDKTKFLVPGDLTMGQMIYVIRKRIKMDSDKAMFIFVDDVMPTTSDVISNIYKNHKDEDGFLYVKFSGENTFG